MTKLDGWNLMLAASLIKAATAIPAPLSAQTFATLVNFDGSNGDGPHALVQGIDGALYGTTCCAVTSNDGGGTVFKVTPSGILTTLHTFCSLKNCADGSLPVTPLLLANDGSFYGTTNGGATYLGTIFRITPEGRLTTLYSFDGDDGANPLAGLTQGADFALYGTTFGDGSAQACRGNGTVFRFSLITGTLTTLHCFQPGEGNGPNGVLVQARNGTFYGTTLGGGTVGWGTVFAMTSAGSLTTLHNFDSTDGALAYGGLALADGNFYGTTYQGGKHGLGTLFKITPQGQFTSLFNFDGRLDGSSPIGTLMQATDGNLYGTTYTGGGGASNSGTVFEVTRAGTLIPLHAFSYTDGGWPIVGLMQSTDGTFYGSTLGGGTYNVCDSGFFGCGTLFSLSNGLGPFVTFIRGAGRVGETGGILGQGFTGTISVALNGTLANFTVESDTYLRATVPAGATSGYVTVVTPTGTLTSNVPFHVIP